jgi:N-carbamoylputrescine amidase
MLRLALLQTKWLGSREAMQAQFRALAAEAVARGATVLGLPEFSLAPYFAVSQDPAGFAWAEPLPGGPSDQFFAALSADFGVTVLGSLYERSAEGVYYDTATVHRDGRLTGSTRKIHIPSGPGYNETTFFTGSDAFPIHDLGGLRAALPTCYDQWFPEIARISALKGAELIFYPTAIGSEPMDQDFDSQAAWQRVMQGHAVANTVFVAACNRVGHEDINIFYGSSFICDPSGTILAQAERDTVEVIVADLDPAVLAKWRAHFPLLHQRRVDAYGDLLQAYDQGDPPKWLNEARAKAYRP